MSKLCNVYLIDLPTFPKGVISLTFSAIAASLPKKCVVHFIDLNISDLNQNQISNFKNANCLFIGIKVSMQNYQLAIQLSKKLKNYNASLKIIFGGEYPSLLPHEAVKYADVIVCGAFESVCDDLIKDIESNQLQKIYDGKKSYNCSILKSPDYSIIKNKKIYSQTMGFPLETSRGCDKKCTFCMVHTMQPVNNFKTAKQLQNELNELSNEFINVIDYNIGSNIKHLNTVIAAFTNSTTLGWMCEMCLETLDDEVLLKKLAKSGCKIIYCGLESISQTSLQSINKAKTNNSHNYARIIKKAQSYGIQIAAGIIVGLEGSTKESIDATFQFYQDIGIIYAKITFLTYNPGTKVYESMKRMGTYLTNDLSKFDGNHFTFLPHGVNKEEVLEAVTRNLKLFYSEKNILKRSENANLKGIAQQEFILFNQNYKAAYLKWFKNNIFESEEGFNKLLTEKYKKSKSILLAEQSITKIRRKIKSAK